MPTFRSARAGARLATLAALLGLGTAAGAQESPRVYFGLTAGVAAIVAKDYDTDKNETGSGRPSAGVFAGVRLLEFPVGKGLPLGLEAGYQDIASHTIPYRIAGGTTDLTARGHSTYLALRLGVPLSERVSLYGRLGAARNVVDGNTPAGQTPIDIDGRKTGVLTGFGGEFVIATNLLLRVEATSFGKGSANSRVGGVSAGVAVGF